MAVFWFMMQIGLIFGFVTTYPANWLLVKWGVKSAM
jgi:preprotein translocase subunit SecD